MPIQNNPNIYTGGNVVLDSNPHTRLAIQLMQQNKAKGDALDAYNEKKLSTFDDKGLREQDTEVFNQGLGKLQQYFSENKDAIRKGTTPEAFNYNKMFREQQDIVRQSKDRKARYDAAMKYYNTSLRPKGRTPKEFWEAVNNNELPINQGAAFDLTKYASQAIPIDSKTHLGLYSDLKRTPTITYKDINGEPYKKIEVTTEKFGTPELETILRRAHTNYQDNDPYAAAVDKELADPVSKNRLAQTYLKNWGVLPTTNDELAAAYSLEQMQPEIVKEKTVDKGNKSLDNAIKIEGIRNEHIIARGKGQQGLTTPDNLLNQYNLTKGQNILNPITGKTIRYIDASKIDVGHLDVIGIHPVDIGGGMKGYIINDDGSWSGGDSKLSENATPDGVQQRWNNKYGNTKVKLAINTPQAPLPPKTPQKIVAPKGKIF